MESIGFLVHDILMTMETELNQEPLSASGGGSRPALLEFLADLLNRPVGHSSMRDRTALGVLQLLLHANALGEMTTAPAYDAIYHPRKNETWRREKLKTWAAALKQVGIEAVKKV
jgi:glycerol kinase